ncbi:MAG TPA: class I SAM-dependent methyltransferase [Balneolaceae bacterium]|nr:class I SAM-dependent methyltransferase [Balneolaceae bacterium]
MSGENKWETFANKNAKGYVDTSVKDLDEEERAKIFFESGQKFTKKRIAKVADLLPDKEHALEIGAGVGRLTIPHAQIFEEVIAVDISPTMIEKMTKNAGQVGLKNIHPFLPEEPWDEEAISYAYSYFVFQHIADFTVIENYIQRIAGCLKIKGIAQLHFDTRKSNFLYRLRSLIPDFLLPETQKKGIQRIRRNPDQLRRLFKKHNLEIVGEYGCNTANAFFLLRKY